MYKRIKPSCKTVFKINISSIGDTELNDIIDVIGVEPGISESFLYYGFMKRNTDDKYFLFEQVDDTLSLLLNKKEELIRLREMYHVSYCLEIIFSDIEDEIKRNTSFEIGISEYFIEEIGGYINLNNGYLED
jgi:hypothetical protein